MNEKQVRPYPTGIRGDYELLMDLGELCGYLVEMAQELHGRIFPNQPYARSLLTCAELEARLSSAKLLMEALYPLQSCWEIIGLKNGPQAHSLLNLLHASLESNTFYRTDEPPNFDGAA